MDSQSKRRKLEQGAEDEGPVDFRWMRGRWMASSFGKFSVVEKPQRAGMT